MFRSTFIASIVAGSAFVSAATVHAQTIPGLVAAYGFEEGSGTTIGDLSGQNNNGVASGTTWSTAGKFGNALVFNGTNAQVTVPNAASLQLTTGMTLEAWVFPTTAPTGWRAIIDKNVDGYYLMGSTDNGNRPGAGGTWTNGNKNVFGTAVLPANTWTHLATTFDGTAVRLFVNGVQVASLAQTVQLAPTTATLQIGGDAYAGENFAGLIDEVRVYNRALSAAEIQADMGVAIGTPPPPVLDTVAPSAPGTLTTTASGSTQVNLSWGAATDNVGVTGYRVERCAGAGCSTFAQIATPTGTSFGDTGLTAGTSYSYRVRATDAAGNLGGYSNVASATTTTPDTTPPSAPSALSATAASATQINLSWAAATDNVGVTGYRVERCQGDGCTTFAQISTPTATTFNNTGLTASTSYSYRVLAVDAAGNLSAYSSVASATTLAVPDTTAPTAPTGLSAKVAGATQVDLAWTASTDNVGVTSYQILRCQGSTTCTTFAQVGTSTVTSFSNTGLTPSTIYRFRVRAVDGAGNVSGNSNTVNATTTAAPDTTPPSAPGGLAAVATSQSQISVSWTAATDNVGVIGYQLERCSGSGCSAFAQIAAPSATSFNDTGLTASTSYSYRARAVDGAGNLGSYSSVASATTLAPDLTPPTAPTGFTATATSASQVNLSWTASTDNVAVTGYILQRCLGAGCSAWTTIATPTGTTYSDTGLSATTTYRYWVRATDAAGNLSPWSSIVTVTTLTPDTSGLVAAFGFDEGAGTAIRDASSQNNTGVASNTTWTTGKFGNALVFNGTNSQVTIADAPSLRLTTAATLEAWVFPTSAPTGWRAIIDKNVDGYYLFASTDNGNRPAGGGTWTSGNQNTFGPSAIPVNSWTHLATTFDGTTVRLFVNGVQVASQAQTAQLAPTTGTLQIGADFYPTEYFAGLIDEVRIYNRALSPAEIQVDMLTPVSGAAPPPQTDTTPPSVNITSPANGATVTNTVSVSANATDNVGVSSVQFLLDGAALGSPVSNAPFSVAWDTATAVAGNHTLQARATDFAGNVSTSASVAVTVGTPTGSTAGQWAAPVTWPIVAVNAALLPTGEILAWDGQDFGNQARVWSPATGVFANVPNTLTNMFCSGQCLLPDGRALVVGGHIGAHVGLPDTNIFDPATRAWSRMAPMAVGRWYPTVTQLPDGRMLVTSGEIDCGGCYAPIPEVYDPQLDHWTQLTGASQSFPYYPHMFVLSDGRVLAASTTEAPIVSRVLNIATQTWSVVDSTAVDGGSAAMYASGKILKSGRSVDPDQPVIPSTATTYVLDMNQATPRWRQTAPMNFARTFHTLTVLPDGTVLATGGGPDTNAVGVDNAVLAAELWSPVTETWTTLASMSRPRLYHSNALLLPDARVLILGGGRFNGGDAPTDQKSSEIFSPPYLFKGPRPVIASAPSATTYGTNISVQTPDAASIGSVVLMKLGTVTHSFNTNQRIVPLAFTAGSGTLSVQTPANANLAPPGHYMLFILNTNGVPSVASIVQLQ